MHIKGRITEMHIKGRISMSPGSCVFPYKALSSLTWDVCFSLTDSNLSTFWLPGFCWENYTSRLLPYLLGAVLWSALHLYAGLESSASPPNKTQFLSFRWCVFFSVDTTMYPALLQAPRIQRRWKQQNPWLLGSLHSNRTRRKNRTTPLCTSAPCGHWQDDWPPFHWHKLREWGKAGTWRRQAMSKGLI